jgi:hypothetical protein
MESLNLCTLYTIKFMNHHFNMNRVWSSLWMQAEEESDVEMRNADPTRLPLNGSSCSHPNRILGL